MILWQWNITASPILNSHAIDFYGRLGPNNCNMYLATDTGAHTKDGSPLFQYTNPLYKHQAWRKLQNSTSRIGRNVWDSNQWVYIPGSAVAAPCLERQSMVPVICPTCNQRPTVAALLADLQRSDKSATHTHNLWYATSHIRPHTQFVICNITYTATHTICDFNQFYELLNEF